MKSKPSLLTVFYFSALCFFTLLKTAPSYATPPFDFDSDGYSDSILINIDSGGLLQWRVVQSSNGASSRQGTLGTNGDHVIVGSWFEAGSTQIGVVGKNSNKDLVWSVRNGDDTTTAPRTFTLGKVGDVAVAAGDFNGNGLADGVTVSKSNRRALWKIYSDPFSATSGGVREVRFGKWTDKLFISSLTEAKDVLGVVSKDFRNRTVIQYYDLATNTRTVTRRFPRIFSNADVSEPIPLKRGDGSTDLLVYRSQNDQMILYVYSKNGRRVTKITQLSADEVIVGNFSVDAGEEIGLQRGEVLTIINPYTGTVSTKSIGNGILVDKQNINEVQVEQPTTPPTSIPTITIPLSPTVATTPGDPREPQFTPAPAAGGESSQCSAVSEFPSSHIYKILGSTHFTPNDIRRKTIGLVIKQGGVGPFPSCIDVVDTSGNIVAKMGLYSRGDGWAARYYAGIGCGTSTPFGGSEVAGRAQAGTGNSDILFNMGSVCFGPINANECKGSSQC
jgi:hypothetical protein